jgi:hypothetical protein
MGVEKNTRTLIAAVSAIVLSFAGTAYGASDYSDLHLKQDVDEAGGAVPSNAAMKASRQACSDLLPTQGNVVCERYGTVIAWLPGSRAAAARPDEEAHDQASSLQADGKSPVVTGSAVHRRGSVVHERPLVR